LTPWLSEQALAVNLMCGQKKSLASGSEWTRWSEGIASPNPVQASGTTARKGQRRPLVGYLILVCSVFMLPVILHRLQPPMAPAEPVVNEHFLPRSRTFLRDGSIYQNGHMTLWSDSGTPISVTLRIVRGSEFKLLIDNLNSFDGGSKGWIALSGTFDLEEQQGHPQVVPKLHEGTEALQCDNLNRASSFALGLLNRVGRGLLSSVLHMQVDAQRDEVYVAPRASALRVLWDQPVVLRLTAPQHLWKP